MLYFTYLQASSTPSFRLGSLAEMKRLTHFNLLTFKMIFSISFIAMFNFPLATSTRELSATTSVTKDGIPCTMCYACENPCIPVPTPYLPPPPPPSPPPPMAPPLPYCPPPPAPPKECLPFEAPPGIYPCPPPPIKPQPINQPSAGGGAFYGPPGYGYNPASYFPYYIPPPSSALRTIKQQVPFLSLSLAFVCLFIHG